MKKNLSLIAKFFIVTVFCLFLSTIFRYLIRNLLIEPYKMDNAFTRIVMFDTKKLQKLDSLEDVEISLDTLYPFSIAETTINEQIGFISECKNKYEELVETIKEKIDDYSSEHLLGNGILKDLAAIYDRTINWNLSSVNEYNSVVFLKDGHLKEFIKEVDTKECARNITELKEYCDGQNIDFLYVQLPYKISKYSDTDISGVLDFSNQNADSLTKRLEEKGIAIYDIREEIANEGFDHHDLFYVTDHHWKVETGLWAAQKILRYLDDNYELELSPELLDKELFEKEVYEDWFLGSKGKKVTLHRTEPDDISLLYPLYECNLELTMPKYSLEKEGDFSILYDMQYIEEKDYYNLDPYRTFLYGTKTLINIENQNNLGGSKILYICDSFGQTTCPFMALGVEYLDVIDLRKYEGSLKAYIETAKPDMIVIAYNPNALQSTIQYENHNSLFDFR